MTRVVGPSDDPRNVYEALFASIGTSREFPRKVEEEAEAVAHRELGERRDLRHLPTVTIDGADAKDFDDAISVERSADGYSVWVHIADVTHYVEPGSALDRQAAYRGNSVYLPGTVAPMLPGRLSNDVCSLRPHVGAGHRNGRDGGLRRRRDEELGPSAASSSATPGSPTKAWTRSCAARRTIEETGSGEGGVRALAAGSRRGRRCVASWSSAGGSRSTRSDEDGVPVAARVRRSTPARELIEELMVLANESVAKMLRGKKGGVFRVHERPDAGVAGDLGREARRRRDAGRADAGEPRHHLPDGEVRRGQLPDTALHPARPVFARATSGTTGSRWSTTRTLPPRSGATPTSSSTAPCWATSRPTISPGSRAHISEREYRSTICERTADEYTLMWLMRDRVGEEPGRDRRKHRRLRALRRAGDRRHRPRPRQQAPRLVGARAERRRPLQRRHRRLLQGGGQGARRIDGRTPADAAGRAEGGETASDRTSRETRRPCTTSPSRRPTRPASS